MLNLSDKELDRFSKEAAEEYEPGDVLGPRSWDRLEVRMTQEFGRPGWNPIRHIRRFPFYYAPALLFLMGVTYYLVRQGSSSGSSPGKIVKIPTQKTSVQPQNSDSADKTTSTPETNTEFVRPDGVVKNGGAGGASAAGGASTAGGARDVGNAGIKDAGKAGVGRGQGTDVGTSANGAAPSGSVASGNGAANGTAANGTSGTRGSDRGNAGRNGFAGNGAAAASGSTSRFSAGAPVAGRGKGEKGTGSADKGTSTGDNNTIAVTAPLNAGHGRNGRSGGRNGAAGSKDKDVAGANGDAATGGTTNKNGNAGAATVPPAAKERELTLSLVQGPHSLGKKKMISDSALRSFNSKSTLTALIKGKNPYNKHNRDWQFGLMVAPDFASVNSLAGDRAGSSFGLTVDYQILPRFYVSSGILATRKNYAARSQDYHAPPGFYQGAGIFGAVDFVKGSFYMMEIPLNLRYDFSVAGNTMFFISGGSSSYLMTRENANLYWRRGSSSLIYCNPTDHLSIKSTTLFATVNLSAGVETVLSNSLSMVIAPYMKLPTKELGFGHVQMNSVGINFGLKWAPDMGSKRHH